MNDNQYIWIRSFANAEDVKNKEAGLTDRVWSSKNYFPCWTAQSYPLSAICVLVGRSKMPVPSDVAEINENPWAPEGLGFARVRLPYSTPILSY